ncbi:MAG TPA: sigma-54 dependent transcriptional regulator [Armatimonadota bacterium]|nr:sigma-54 dependent transcriptional regulator [Armatimonadota bacterium]HQK93226.1 sigma-54 dependent transcriptional regulator [Armatimonadota bacterium]
MSERLVAARAIGDPILVVDDQAAVRDLLTTILSDRGHRVVQAPSGEEALEHLRGQRPFSVVILDLDFGAGRMSGMDVLRRIRADGNDMPVIVLTGQGSVGSAVEAIKCGASDYLEKDAYLEDTIELSMDKIERLVRAIEENRRLAEEYKRLKRQTQYLEEQVGRRYDIVGSSEAIRAALARVERVAKVPRPVLIRGERGTGKELFAAAIHRASPRSEGPFVTVNCAAIPEGLLECELFGQEEDAFNNAPFKLGRFDLAERGTLFLDEIGNMGPEFQQKILRVIEYRTFERVQGNQTLTADVRIVAATNTDLEAAMAAGTFRADLHDRLAFETITLPPLRERIDDIPELADHFIQRFRAEVAGLVAHRLSPAALARLADHNWPGNVRELKNVVERAAYRCDRETIGPEDLDLIPSPRLATEAATATTHAPLLTEGPLPDRIAAFERQAALEALERCGWNQRKAASRLGLNYDQFRHLYRKYDLGRERPGAQE